MEAYIRIGNESIIVPDHILNELILTGTNRSFDAMTTDVQKADHSFTLLEATYLERTGLRFEPSDYISFGLADMNGLLTNTGRLMADQYIVRNSRIFCTRWNGLDKGSVFDDALDDKEYEGNLIGLLRNSGDFVCNNSKVRFVKEADYRVDKIDMYDDRLEIQSPGGMYDGRAIQGRDVRTIGSAMRNPVIADLFHRMKFMERRGSGLTKIMNETAKLPGYEDRMRPEFFSTPSDFRVVLKHVNYLVDGRVAQDTMQDTAQDTAQDDRFGMLVEFCAGPRTRDEMQLYVGIEHREYFRKAFLKPLLESGRLQMTIPDKPNSRNQTYIAARNR